MILQELLGPLVKENDETLTNKVQVTPWNQLKEYLESGERETIEQYLEDIGPAETARAISRLDQETQSRLMLLLDPEDAADILMESPSEQAIDLIEDLDPQMAAKIVEEMYSDDQADLLSELDSEDAEAILGHMDPEDAKEVRELMSYREDTAGGLMITEYLEYEEHMNVKEVLKDFYENGEEYADYEVSYVYVVNDERRLLGVVKLNQLLLAPRDKLITDYMNTDVISFTLDTHLEDLEEFFDSETLNCVPIVDGEGRLEGIVRGAAVRDALRDREAETYMKSSGIVGGEEIRSMPYWTRSYRRFSWLSTNIVLNVLAASVIALYQDVLEEVIALTVFLPVVSALSGSSGSQAVAVSIRELALGLVTPSDVVHVIKKELMVGISIGLGLGALLAAITWAWKGNLWLGAVIGVAMAINNVIGAVCGGAIPLLLRKANLDPALASTPILTTITDIAGFFLVLSLAGELIQYLK